MESVKIPEESLDKVLIAERRLLTRLITAPEGAVPSDRLRQALRDYRFQSLQHQVIFDCLKGIPAARLDLAATLLAERLVRAGFPDLDLTPFLRRGDLSDEDAWVLCRSLVEAVPARPGENEASDTA